MMEEEVAEWTWGWIYDTLIGLQAPATAGLQTDWVK